MSIEDKILQLLLEPKYRYKGMPVSALGLPVFSLYKHRSVENAITKLLKKNMIQREGSDRIMVRKLGIVYGESIAVKLKLFDRTSLSNAKKKLLVLFDIPENRKGEREWFRHQLREFGYKMVQRSVWLGPGPLPKEFIEYCKSIGLKDCVKIFTVTKDIEIIL